MNPDRNSLAQTSDGDEAPVASVVVCVYKRAQQVVNCLESLLAQDFRPFEIIVVDDASTDDTPEVLANFVRSHDLS